MYFDHPNHRHPIYDPKHHHYTKGGFLPKGEKEYVNTDEYKPSSHVHFDTKENRGSYSDYFFPPISNEMPKASVLYPTVLDDELIMTRRGIVNREKS